MTRPDDNQTASRAPTAVRLPERLVRDWVEQTDLLRDRPRSDLLLDLADTAQIDSAGASLIHVLRKEYERAGYKVRLTNISEALSNTLRKWTPGTLAPAPSHEPQGFFADVGEATLTLWDNIVCALSVLVEMIYWGTLGVLKRRDFRKGVLGEQMYQLGYKAIGIVALLAFLIGVVVALQTAIQLRMLGGDIFLAPLVGFSFVREFGPLMTAIILAGRSGSATTAEIATMSVQEEIDALRTMSINPIQFVVVPKFWAISLTMPLLSIMAVGAGIFGGFLVGVFYLNLAPDLFWGEMWKGIGVRDFLAGFIKSVVFSWLIIWIGAYFGFRASGGAEEVGKETTAAVVVCIFVIILADAVFSFLI